MDEELNEEQEGLNPITKEEFMMIFYNLFNPKGVFGR